MAHLPYADITHSSVAPLAARIREARGEVLHLYRMLLHSPPLAETWLAFLSVIRGGTTVPPRVRELVIMQVAHLNGAPYEADQHAPLALAAGVTPAQLAALNDWADPAAPFDAHERDVLAYCAAISRDIHAPAALVSRLHDELGAQQLVELTVTIAAYNMVSRTLEALGIRSEDDVGDE